MCNPRCVNCNGILDSEDSGESNYCEECLNERLEEAENKAFFEGFNDALLFRSKTEHEVPKWLR